MWLLSIVTLGIYGLVVHYRINRELQEFGVEVDPTKAALAMFPGGIVAIPYLVTTFRTGERVAVAQEAMGLEPTARGVLAAVGSIFFMVNIPYLQSELNRVWEASTPSTVRSTASEGIPR